MAKPTTLNPVQQCETILLHNFYLSNLNMSQEIDKICVYRDLWKNNILRMTNATQLKLSQIM